MRPGEPLLPALRRVQGLPPGELRALSETARAAAVRLADRTVAHWLRVLTAVAPADREA
jgi:hypothetical protein